MNHLIATEKYLACPHTCVAIAAARSLGLYPPRDYASNSVGLCAPVGAPCVVMATASPCKFRESVSASIGEDGWAEYEATSLPESARAILAAEETPPEKFHADKEDLKATQQRWEMDLRELVEGLR